MSFERLPRLAALAGLGRQDETGERVAEVQRILEHYGHLRSMPTDNVAPTYSMPAGLAEAPKIHQSPADEPIQPATVDGPTPPLLATEGADDARLRRVLVAIDGEALLVPAPAAGRGRSPAVKRARPESDEVGSPPTPPYPAARRSAGQDLPTDLTSWRNVLKLGDSRTWLDRCHAVIDARADLNAFVSRPRPAANADPTPADRSPWRGIPVAVKDNLNVKDQPLTAGSRILNGFVPPEDATAVVRLRRAGAVVVGKTNLDEFGMGSSTEFGISGATKNPHLPDRVAGGSSGGSAAAVAAGLVPVALGSDTGGSIRQPAAFCGIVGFKPTWGRVSRRGLVAFASSLDTVGPLARSVRDAAEALQVIAGPDPGDATAADRPLDDLVAAADASVRGLKVGVPRPYVDVHPDLEAGVDLACRTLTDAGAIVRPVELPYADLALSAYVIIAAAEASSNLARYDGIRYGRRAPNAEDLDDLYTKSRSQGFGPEVQRRIIAGTYVLTAGYDEGYMDKAARLRTLIIRGYETAFAEVDILLGATVPEPPFPLASRLSDPLALYRTDALTVGPSLAGLPALAVPIGTTALGIPGSVQLVAPWWQEGRLVTCGATVEQANGAG